MQYEMEELVPIVTKLARKCTSGESTSITYEKAQQLMEAVLYTIREGQKEGENSLMETQKTAPEKAYEIGVRCVEQKIKDTLAMYNELMTCFNSYENECLYDTVARGLPEFFKWYEYKFEPQNTILTLDYPVLGDNCTQSGIDRIHDYICCIRLEQRFLNRFPTQYIIQVLSQYHSEYRILMDNLCEIVLKNLLLHMLIGKDIQNLNFCAEECEMLQQMIQSNTVEALREKLKRLTNALVTNYYEGDVSLVKYLGHAIESISIRIKSAADHESLIHML